MWTSLIGLVGKKQQGKTFTANLLALKITEHFPEKKVEVLSFSEVIKSAVQTVFGLRQEELTDGKLKEEELEQWHVTPRELFQQFGTEVLRQQLPKLLPHLSLSIVCGEESFQASITTKRTFQKVKKALSDPDTVVILEDVRFKDEAKLVEVLGGVLVRIIRPEQKGEKQHVSTTTASKKRKRRRDEIVYSYRSNKYRRKRNGDAQGKMRKGKIHRSETELEQISARFTLANAGSVEDLSFLLNLLVQSKGTLSEKTIHAGDSTLCDNFMSKCRSRNDSETPQSATTTTVVDAVCDDQGSNGSSCSGSSFTGIRTTPDFPTPTLELEPTLVSTTEVTVAA